MGMSLATAKVFTTGNSQAIRLPKAFRLDTHEVWVSKSTNGIITIQPKPKADELDAFFAQLQAIAPSDEFLQPRDDAPRRNPFEDWGEGDCK
jgi:antitoxin VapB